MSECLYPIDKWVTCRLDELGTITTGATPPTNDGNNYEGDIPFVGPADLGHKRWLSDTSSRLSELGAAKGRVAKRADTLVSCIGTLGKVSQVSELTGFNQQLTAISPRSGIDENFLFYAASQLAPILERLAGLQVLPIVNKRHFSAIKITFPKRIAVQRKIAAILTAADTAIEKTEALIAKYQQIKAGLMHDLFTRGVLPNGQLRPSFSEAPELYHETAIGWIPKDWSVSKLGALASIVSGVTLGAKSISLEVIEVPYLRVANVQDGYLNLAEIKTIFVTRKTLDHLRLLPGDVLMNEGGDFDKLGRGSVWSGQIDNCIHQNHVFRVRPSSTDLEPNYLSFYSQSAFGKKYFLVSSKQSTNLASINSSQLNAYPIALPNPAEQKLIALRINVVNARLDTLLIEVDKRRKQKLGLMQDLLTGRVSVKVDPNEMANA
jgi:type I restriction enzyme, S subunit